jgi:hypothetical protein
MPEETKTPAATEVKLTPELERSVAIAAYYEATTREAKAAAVKKFPVLKTIFSDCNHS